jgi:hypothetical protein
MSIIGDFSLITEIFIDKEKNFYSINSLTYEENDEFIVILMFKDEMKLNLINSFDTFEREIGLKYFKYQNGNISNIS